MGSAPVATIEFLLLGPLEVWRQGQPLELAGPKARKLLAMLLLHAGEVVSADRLIDALWGERPPPGATNALQAHVAHLRRAFGNGTARGYGVLQTRSPGYVIELDDDALDIRRFERLTAEGQRELARDPASAAVTLRRAVSLWRGPALAEFVYEPFAVAEAARLEELRLGALEDRLEADLLLGRHAEVVAELESLAEAHPFRERLAGQLITALYRCDRQADATQVFHRARARLIEELGLEPGAALRELHQRVLDQDPGLRATAAAGEPAPAHARRGSRRTHNLPAELTSFIGREQELTEVHARLRDARLLTLTGPGGSGKTRLALRVAGDLRAEYPDGVWLVELAPLTDAALLPKAVASCLEVRADSTVIGAVLPQRLRGAHLLLVLDNCEHLIAACAQLVRELLEAAEGVWILATSREPLNVAGEITWPVPGLAVPKPAAEHSLDEVMRSPAVRLFIERARAIRPAFELDSGSAPAVAELCRRLDGMPLAIELAAARVRMLSPREIETRLHDRFALLTGGRRGVLARQQTLRATVDWSHDLLAGSERALFRRLGVFAGGWTLADAEHVCVDEALPSSAVLELLSALVDKSLVVCDPAADGATRYRLLETLREYAQERLDVAGERESVGERHFEHFLRLAEGAREQKLTSGGDAGLAMLLSQQDNLRAALRFARGGDPMRLLRLATAMDQLWHAGNLEEGRMWLTAALAQTPEPTVARARALHVAGSLFDLQQDHDAARKLVSEALVLASRLHDDNGAAWARLTLGLIEITAERFDAATEHLEAGLATHERSGDRFAVCRALIYLGWAHTQVAGRADDGWRDLQRGLRLAQELGDRWGEGFALLWLGFREIEAGNRQLAAARLRGTLLTEALGPIRGGGLDGLASLALEDDPARTLRLIAAAVSLRERHGGQPPPFLKRKTEAVRVAAERRLGQAAARRAWEDGLRMSTDEAIAYALGPHWRDAA